jgi:Lar family restriction alleviation protein
VCADPLSREERGRSVEELKKCPFCGGEAKIYTMDSCKLEMVVCIVCKAHSALCYSEEEAIEAWNRRVGECK